MSTSLVTRQTAGIGATVKEAPLTNTEVDTNFINLNIAVQPAGGTAGQVLSKIDGTDFNSQWIDNYSGAVRVTIKAGVALTKGQAVYITGASGANIIVGLAQANTEATSSKTFGLISSTLALNGFGDVICEGPLSGIDTSSATEGDPVWLSPTTAGGLVFGLANKPSAPNHLVYIGVVSRAHATQGQIQVKVQNGFELNELHDVQITSTANNDIIQYNSASAVWKNVTPANARTNLGLAIGTDVQAFSSSLTAISASQTANYFLAAPNGAAGVPTFRALVAADVPTLNQNTTGNAATATTANALNTSNSYTTAGLTSTGDITRSNITNGTISLTGSLPGYAANTYPTLSSSGTLYFASSGVYAGYWSGNSFVSNGNVTAYSDERVKANWRVYGPNFVERLTEVLYGTYDRVDCELTQDGVSAQSLQKLLPHSVVSGHDDQLSVNYGSAAMVSVIEVAKRLIALEAKVAKIVE